jgi:hypothetical protein
MGTLIVVAVIISVFIVLFRVRGGFRKYKAALNCLMAKATFSQANDDLKSAAVFGDLNDGEGMFRMNGHRYEVSSANPVFA